MEKVINNPYLDLISRVVVGLVFVIFAVEKIADPKFFANEIGNYNIVPNSFVNIIAIVLPWIELVAGLLFISGVKIKANSILLSALLLVFIIGVASAMARGLDISCGCSKANPSKVGIPKILENLGLIALCALSYFSKNNRFTLSK